MTIEQKRIVIAVLAILFLIPLPWVGPVAAPALIAAIMVAAGLGIERLKEQGKEVRVRRRDWAITIASALALLVIFMWDAPGILEGRLPGAFPWPAYFLALSPSVAVAVSSYRRSLAATPAES